MDILQILTQIRESPYKAHEKARWFSEVVEKAGVTDIRWFSCDVCERELNPDYEQIFREVCEECGDDTESIAARMDELTPHRARTRVQAQTDLGYLTFCFYCDSTMCCNEVEYPDNPDWDELHKERARRFLIEYHPEWEVESFILSGSTRWIINIDVLAGENSTLTGFWEGEFEGYAIFVICSDPQLLQRLGLLEMYEPL